MAKIQVRTVVEYRRSESPPGWRDKAGAMTAALYDVVCALGNPGLSFEDKRTVLMWAAEAHSIDPGKLLGREFPK